MSRVISTVSAAVCLVLVAWISEGAAMTAAEGGASAATSSASSPAYSTSPAIPVAYSASSTAGLARVELWARAPDAAGFSRFRVHTVSGNAVTGSFSYSAAAEGAYDFYTVAVDAAGNAEGAPASPDTATVLDRSLPTSTGASPSYTNSASFPVTYEAEDRGPSGLGSVRLFAKAPGAGGYRREAVDATPDEHGAFQYTAVTPDGTYSFYTRALDKAGNDEPAPPSPDAVTVLDRRLPTSRATVPDTVPLSRFRVGYDASDTGPAGLAEVQLWAKGPGDAAYSRAATDTSPLPSGGIDYRASSGEGTYSFFTVAVDRAGNAERAPTLADDTTVYASIPPSVTVEGLSDALVGPTDASVDVTWRSDQPGTYAVRVGGADCETGAVAAAGDYSGGAVTTSIGADLLGEGTTAIRFCVSNEDARTGSAATVVEKDTRAPSVAIAFAPDGSALTAAGWEAGCGTPSGDVCGTAADETTAVDFVHVSLQRAADGAYWDGASFSGAAAIPLDASGTTAWSYAMSSAGFLADGPYVLRARAVDRAGNTAEAVSAFTVDVPPKVDAGGPYTGPEGSAIRLAGAVSSDATSVAWTYEAVGGVDSGAACTLDGAGTLSPTFTCTDDGTYRLTLTASDGTNPPVARSATVTVSNAAPAVVVQSPLNGAFKSRFIPVTLTATFHDAGRNDSHRCEVDWGDGAVTTGAVVETVGSGSGTCSATHAYASSGARLVRVTVTDDDGGSGTGTVSLTML